MYYVDYLNEDGYWCMHGYFDTLEEASVAARRIEVMHITRIVKSEDF